MIDVEGIVQAVEDAAAEAIRDRLDAAALQASEAVARAYVAGGHVKSWDMVKSIYYAVDPEALKFKVVVGEFYSAFLEFGTKHQPARFVATRAILDNLNNTIAILEGDK